MFPKLLEDLSKHNKLDLETMLSCGLPCLKLDIDVPTFEKQIFDEAIQECSSWREQWGFKELFNDKEELESSMFNYLNLQKEKQSKEYEKKIVEDFHAEKLTIDLKPYYFSNIIARCSKTMIECNNSKLNFKSTGTEG